MSDVHSVGATPPAAAALGWISVEERMPANETDVLVRTQFGSSVRCDVAGRFQGWSEGPWGWYTYQLPDKELTTVTHWQPLPSLAVPVPPPAAPDGVPSTLDRINPKE